MTTSYINLYSIRLTATADIENKFYSMFGYTDKLDKMSFNKKEIEEIFDVLPKEQYRIVTSVVFKHKMAAFLLKKFKTYPEHVYYNNGDYLDVIEQYVDSDHIQKNYGVSGLREDLKYDIFYDSVHGFVSIAKEA